MRDWQPPDPVDVLVSNAVLHWVPGHDRLLARWAGSLRARRLARRAGAGQLPGADARAAGRALPVAALGAIGSPTRRPAVGAVLEPAGYLDVLTAAGLSADVWETTYLHVLTGRGPGAGWVRSTVLRPVLARLDEDRPRRSSPPSTPPRCGTAYPRRPDGRPCCPSAGVFAVGAPPGPQRGVSR